MVLTSIASISKFKIVSVHISCTLNKQIPYIFQGVPCMLLIHLLSRCGTWLAVHAGVTVIQLHSCLAHSSLNWGLCTLSWILAISSIFYLNPYLCLSYVVGFVVFGVCCSTVEQWSSAGNTILPVFCILICQVLVIHWFMFFSSIDHLLFLWTTLLLMLFLPHILLPNMWNVIHSSDQLVSV